MKHRKFSLSSSVPPKALNSSLREVGMRVIDELSLKRNTNVSSRETVAIDYVDVRTGSPMVRRIHTLVAFDRMVDGP
jgi:hypothetical protein